MPILHWLNKEEAVTTAKKCDYRLLEEVPELSYGDPDNENLLIQGDNLEALKALLPFYAGKVKCIYIDPPYNTKSAFEHYDDNLEHSKWLSMMYPRLELLRELLCEDGSIWITLDDNESHYLRVMCDEIFGRNNFIANFVWQKKFSPQNDAKYVSDMHDHLLCFAKNKEFFKIGRIVNLNKKNRSKNLDNDKRGAWKSVDYTCNKNKFERPNLYYPITQPNTGQQIWPKETAVWRYSQETNLKHVKQGLIYWGKNGENSVPRFKKFETEEDKLKGDVPVSILFQDDVGNTQEARKESLIFNSSEPFSTPKPERLIERVLLHASEERDFVLDSFLGSATTSAVAQKMNRRYIGVEIGEHAKTHCQPRLQKVVDGEQGGISEAVNWQGGGGFRFCQLGSTVFDEYGCLNPEIRFAALAAHIWYLETKQPFSQEQMQDLDSPLLGEHKGGVYYLLYNGILGDRRPQGGNVLTSKVLDSLPDIEAHIAAAQQGKMSIVVYGESTRLGEARLQQAGVQFKQIPYDVGAF